MGLLADWLTEREQEERQIKITCTACGAEMTRDLNFCGMCGAKLPPRDCRCPRCSRTIPGVFKFCGRCGAPSPAHQQNEQPQPRTQTSQQADNAPQPADAKTQPQ